MRANITAIRFLLPFILLFIFQHQVLKGQSTEELFTLPELRFGVLHTDDIFNTSNASLFFRGDTLYNEEKYLIYQHHYGFNFYLKIDEDKIYEGTVYLDEPTGLLFDFGLEVGDTFNYDGLVMATIFVDELIVTDKSVIQLDDGLDRIKIDLKEIDGSQTLTWIQGIGFDRSGPIIYYNSATTLLCASYSESDIWIADNFSPEECDKMACLYLNADFEAELTDEDNTVFLTNYSNNYDQIEISMGDGTVFNEFISEYTYLERGCYTIELRVWNSCGEERYAKHYFDYCEDPKWYKSHEKKFFEMSFATNESGLAMVQDSIFGTEDGGKTWTFKSRLLPNEASFYIDLNLHYKDDDKIIASLHNNNITQKVFYSSDRGENWTNVFDIPVRIIKATISEDDIILAHSKKDFFKSDDFGASWIEINRAPVSRIIDFAGDKREIIATIDHNYETIPYQYLLQTSKDYGKKWETNYFDKPIYSVYFVDAEVGFIGGYNQVYKTLDGGFTWDIIAEDICPSAITEINFANRLKGTAKINNSIYTTEDGGETWEVEFCTNKEYVSDIQTFEETSFILAGNRVHERNPNPDFDCNTIISTDDIDGLIASIAPNPSHDYFRINSPYEDYLLLEIRNIQGGKVFSKNVTDQETLDISGFEAGLYFISLQSSESTKTFKFIKS